MKSKLLFLTLLCLTACCGFAQYAPPAGVPGTTAIHADSSVITGWATSCELTRGWQNIADTALGRVSSGDAPMATGKAGTNGVVSLGDGGSAVLHFQYPIMDGPGWDFAVFENSFDDYFLELAFVEISSDGINFFRFPAHSLTPVLSQTNTFDSTDARLLNNLAGKYRFRYGTPFDVAELSGIPGLDLSYICCVRIVDVVGSINPEFATSDTAGNIVNDPWPTPFSTGGFDLDAVGAIHLNTSGIAQNIQPDLNLFPNPAAGAVSVIAEAGDKQIVISNLHGEILLTEAIDRAGELKIDLRELAPGLYIVCIRGDRTRQAKLLKP